MFKKISSFADRIREYRTNKEITLAEMEQLTGVPAQTLSRYELGQRIPKYDVAVSIAESLGINPLWLQGYDVNIHGDNIKTSVDNVYPLHTKRVPVLGAIACGEPIWVDEQHGEYVSVDDGIKADFALIAQGDSMTGARSRYSVSYGDNSWGGGEKIIPVSFEAAAQWAEEHLPADKYEAEFGAVPEGDEEYTTTSVRLPLQLHNDLKREAVKQGKSLQALIAEKLAQ